MSIQIIKRTAAIQNHLGYNKGASCFESFTTNIKFPELKDSTTVNKYFVPLLYRVKEDGTIYDIAIEKDFINNKLFRNHHLTTSPKFEMEAIRLMNQSGKWRPFTLSGKYVNREGRIFITFEYHPEYLKNREKGLVLNPDVKAKFNGDKELYNKIICPKNGCDGVVTFLAIIEKDGTISNEYFLQAIGKTNCEMGLYYLKKLSPWKPAIKDGKTVRSQIKITISTS